MRRLELGRLSIYLEPRDIWVGVYVAPTAIYVCPLPLLVIRWMRRPSVPAVGPDGPRCEKPTHLYGNSSLPVHPCSMYAGHEDSPDWWGGERCDPEWPHK